MSQMGINPDEFYDPLWAQENGLFAKVCEDAEELDAAVEAQAKKLAAYNPEAMAELKKVFWRGTDHWDDLLSERAETSGKLVLSDFTRNFIQKFKNK